MSHNTSTKTYFLSTVGACVAFGIGALTHIHLTHLRLKNPGAYIAPTGVGWGLAAAYVIMQAQPDSFWFIDNESPKSEKKS